MIKVDVILTVAQDIPPVFPDKFEYKTLDILDNADADLLKHLGELVAFLEDALTVRKKRVYIHCAAGVSRSASVVVAYFMWKN